MKYIKPLIAFTFAGLISCGVNQKAYNIPPDLSADDKKELLSKIKHGIEMYGVHCQKCHGKHYESQDQGPNFTQEQIRTYEVFMKVRNPTHEFTTVMSTEDLDDIIIFLKYRKPK
jgi:mono/diheme cytochrome c family protein